MLLLQRIVRPAKLRRLTSKRVFHVLPFRSGLLLLHDGTPNLPFPGPFLDRAHLTAIKMATAIGATPGHKMQGSALPDCAGASDNAQVINVAIRKPGRPRKRAPSPHSSSSWQASDPQPAPKPGRGRPRINPLQNPLKPEAHHRKAGCAAGAMPARSAMRATRPTARRQRALSDPYKLLRLNRCETDTTLIRGAYIAAQMSCSDMLPFPAQLGEDPGQWMTTSKRATHTDSKKTRQATAG